MEAIIEEIEDGLYGWTVPLPTGDTILYLASDARRERTGFHAKISIAFNNATLEYDTFNIGRSEDRGRLAKAAHAHLEGSIAEETYSLLTMRRDLGSFCDAFPTYYEVSRLVEDMPDIDVDAPITPLTILLNPYIVEGAGTIIFSPPGGGKTYTGMTMGLMLGTGRSDLWPVSQARPVLWVNLERDGDSIKRRLQMLCRAFNIRGRQHQMAFLHAKGLSFLAVHRRVKAWTREHPTGVVFLDSISRTGQGSMKEDDVANRIIDMLNGAARTWIALGHTPRADDDHQYGNIMFDAGEDIGVKLSSEERQDGDELILGVSLIIKKSNDGLKGQPFYMAFDFKNGELWLVHGARDSDFPKLLVAIPRSEEQKIIDYLLEYTKGTATQVSAATGVSRPNVSSYLSHGDRFVKLGQGKVGDASGVWYGLKAETF